MSEEVILFYDAECRACRAFTRVMLLADRERRLRTAPLNSAEADQRLGHLPKVVRYGSYHLVVGDRIWSGGKGMGPLLEQPSFLRPVGRVVRRSSAARRAAWVLYDFLSRNRGAIGRWLPQVGDPPR